MLSVSTGLLRTACFQSTSHPLQCKALELCLNVALHRLPASSGDRHYYTHYPSPSNALVAAFKRAQAHHRRGAVENQQQSIIVKIELEQLIISILDDPSVSRVMKEAGFSSSQIKKNVEKAVSLELGSQCFPPSAPRLKSKENKVSNSSFPCSPATVKENDVNTIIEALLSSRKKKSFVIVGECISKLEDTVKELMNLIDKGEVPEDFKDVKFVTFPPLHSFYNVDGELAGWKLRELNSLVQGGAGKGVVLYLGDLNWISQYKINVDQISCVEMMIMEIGRLVSDTGANGKFWLMGIATFQTYMRCKNGCRRSLETLWGLHPLTVPANSLGLSLVSLHSDEKLEGESSATMADEYTNCSTKLLSEAKSHDNDHDPTFSLSPTFPSTTSSHSSTISYFSNNQEIPRSPSLSEVMEATGVGEVSFQNTVFLLSSNTFVSTENSRKHQRNGIITSSSHFQLDLNTCLDDHQMN